MNRALIGHSGFVGTNLREAGQFSAFFNSSNFRDMRGRQFDEVVCAGVSAVKWRANKEPDQDWQAIKRLLDVLEEVEAKRFTLISTIDVYPEPSRPDDEALDISEMEGQPYGRHRRAVEKFIVDRFNDTLVARLPALFGRGLKKNIVFDLLTGNQTQQINPATVFQWYPLRRLNADLERAKRADISTINLFPEPVATADILERIFPDARVGASFEPAAQYMLQTRHAAAFGEQGRYIMKAEAVMDELEQFVSRARADPSRELGDA